MISLKRPAAPPPDEPQRPPAEADRASRPPGTAEKIRQLTAVIARLIRL